MAGGEHCAEEAAQGAVKGKTYEGLISEEIGIDEESKDTRTL